MTPAKDNEDASRALPPGVTTTIALLAAAAFFSGAALRICDGLLPRLALDFARTPGTAGQVVISFALAYGFLQLLFGPLGDRYGKAQMVCLAMFGCAAGALACSMAPSLEALVGLRVLWGMAAAGVIPLAMAWIGDTVPYEQRQATLARLLLGTLTGMMVGQMAGGWFADASAGWRGAFVTLSVGYFAVALLLLRRVRQLRTVALPADQARPAFVAQVLSVLRTPWARVVLAAVLAEGVFMLGPMAYLPSYLHLRFGLTLAAASTWLALYAVGGLVYALLARRLVAGLGERRMVLAGGVIMGLGFAAWWCLPTGWLAGPVALGVGFGTYLLHNTLQTHATQMAPAARGTSVAVFAFCLFGGQAIGVTAAGYAFDRWGAAPMLLVAALALPVAGWAFAYALVRRAKGAFANPSSA